MSQYIDSQFQHLVKNIGIHFSQLPLIKNDEESDASSSSSQSGSSVNGSLIADTVDGLTLETQDDISCPICCETFNVEDDVLPVMLPACGHTFCRKCLCNLKALECPTCRTRHIGTVHPKDLPTNYIALNLSKALDKMQTELCETHQESLLFWCNDCRKSVCGVCIFEEHMKDGHKVVKAKDLIDEKKENIKTLGNEMLKGSISRKTSIISEFQISILNMLSKLKDCTDVENSVKTANEVLNKVERCSDSQSNVLNLTRLDSLQNKLNDLKLKVKHLENSESIDKSQLISIKCSSGEESVLPEICCVENKKKLFGRLSWEDEKLHLYAIVEKRAKADVLIKVSLLQPQISTKNPEVFLDVIANGKKLGRIYIRLWGHLRRAQNFLQLCLGTSGISYKQAKFNAFTRVNSSGETMDGGDYISVDNPSVFESKSLLDNLEWGGDHAKPRKRGLILGAGGGKPEHDSRFAICSRDDIDQIFQCPFGEVVAGLSVVDKAIQMQSEDTRILESGVVVIG